MQQLVIDLMVVVYQLDLTILQYMSIEDLLIDLITQQEDHIHLKLMYLKMDLQSVVLVDLNQESNSGQCQWILLLAQHMFTSVLHTQQW